MVMNEITCRKTRSGMEVWFQGKPFRLIYPGAIWSSYPDGIKDVLVDNLAHLLTVNMPLVAGINYVRYNTAEPFFRQLFNEMVIRSIPSSTESYDEHTDEVTERFRKTIYDFSGPKKTPVFSQDVERASVTPLSFGKDSLLTFAVASEIGLDPRPVYINDSVSPVENKSKLGYVKAFSREFTPVLTVTNEVEKLNDFEFWGKDETCLGYMHMVTGFCFIVLPITNCYKAGYIFLGNQKDMDFPFINKDGVLTYPSPDQTTEWMEKQNDMVKMMTKNVSVTSLISPLTNIAIMKVLFSRYRKYAKYEISCDCLEGTNEVRWCHECNKCARLFLFMRAVGADPKTAGFRKNMLERGNKDLFALFKPQDNYEKSREARDQQLLAFYLAMKNNVKGSLMDVFKEQFLEEAQEREEELQKKFFTVYDANMPGKIKKDVMGIYKEELE